MSSVQQNSTQFLSGGGEVGRLMREWDWTKSSLGIPELWPQSFRTAVDIMLHSRIPMFLFWGDDFICFYNDAYVNSFRDGRMHPSLIGLTGEEALGELWPVVCRILQNVRSAKVTVVSEQQPGATNRNPNVIADVRNTFSYAPVTDESGYVAGILISADHRPVVIAADNNIQESEERFRTLADNIPNLAWMANADGGIYWYNKRWYEYTGTTLAQMEGWGWRSVHDPQQVDGVIERWSKSIALGQPFDMIFPIKGADGKYRQFLTRVLPARDRTGVIYHWFGSNTDITDQKKIEHELQESNARFLKSIEQAPVAMAVFKGSNHVVEHANPLMLNLWGKMAEEVLGKPVFEGLPEAKGQGLESIIDNVFNTGEKFEAFERPISLPRNGILEVTYVNFVYEPMMETNGSVSGIIAVASDVTQQVLTRQRIELRESKFKDLITQFPMATVVLRGKDQVIDTVNNAMLKRWNKSESELVNKKFIDAFPEIKDKKFPALLDLVYRTGETYQETESVSVIQNAGGNITSYVDFEYSPLLDADGNVSGVIATVNDVTERVTARKKMEEIDARYETLIYSSPSAIGILHGEKLIITTANDSIIELWGKGKGVMGKPYFEAMPELVEQGYREVFAEVYKTGKPFNAVETPVNILQGGKMTLRYYNFLLYPQRDISGAIDGIGIIATEVTSQAILNKQIQASEKRFRLLADSMPQHIWTSDAEGNLNYFNRSVFDYSGLSVDQIMKDGWLQIVHPYDREKNIAEWSRAISSGLDLSLEHRFKRHDGEYRWQLSRAVPLRDEYGKIYMWVGSSTDIHEQKEFSSELEKQVKARTKELALNNIELSKMNSELQSFAYISSHDLQEPLRKIQTFASRLSETEVVNLTEKGQDAFRRIQAAAARMQTLIQDLLVYSRTNTADRKYEHTDLNKIVSDVKDDLKEELLERNATIDATGLCDLDIIPFQFRQLLHNLISNSLKFSSPDRPPRIVIQSEISSGEEFKNVKLTYRKKYCHISVSDNGIGFEQRYADKIFELFQRLHAKAEYSGTGIGLAIVKKIVENHNGSIQVTSELSKGTTFDIYLPADERS